MQIKKLSELSGHSSAIYALERSEDSACIYSGSGDKIIAKWNLEKRAAEKFAAQMPGFVYSLCLIPGKNLLLAATSEGKIHVIDLSDKKETKILQNHLQAVFDVKYSAEHKLILSAGGDGQLAFTSVDDLKVIKVLKLCNEKLRGIDIQKDLAAIACGDGKVRIIDLKAMSILVEIPAHKDSVYAVKFSPDGKYLLSGGKDAHLNIWDAKLLGNPGQKSLQSIPGHNYAVYSIAFSPDGKLMATASRDKTVKIWNPETFEILARVNKENFDGHINSVNKLLWTEQWLISAGDDRKIMIWLII